MEQWPWMQIFFDAFKPDNDKSKEALSLLPMNTRQGILNQPGRVSFITFNQKDIYGGHRNGNDGIVLIPGVWTKYDDKDLRKRGWFLEGLQLRWDDSTKQNLLLEVMEMSMLTSHWCL